MGTGSEPGYANSVKTASGEVPVPIFSQPRCVGMFPSSLSCLTNLQRAGDNWPTVAIKLLIVVLVVWFIRRTIVDAWKDLESHPLHVDYGWLAAAGGLYLLGSLFCGVFWHRILRAMRQEVGFWKAIRAFYLGHLGKYVPGKAMKSPLLPRCMIFVSWFWLSFFMAVLFNNLTAQFIFG